MTDFTETVKQNAVLTFSVVILSSLALTFLILLYTGIFGTSDKIAETVRDGAFESNAITKPANLASGDVHYVRVSLPMLYGSFNKASVPGVRRGCDTVYMVDAWARADGDAMTQHMQTLFDGITPVDFLPGNYVRVYQRDLNLDRVVVESETARVYLKGELHEMRSSCEAPRLQIQLEEIAFQYPGIKKVQIFVNDRAL